MRPPTSREARVGTDGIREIRGRLDGAVGPAGCAWVGPAGGGVPALKPMPFLLAGVNPNTIKINRVFYWFITNFKFCENERNKEKINMVEVTPMHIYPKSHHLN